MIRYAIRGRRAAAIARSIEQGIYAGALAAGHALPPVRTLAASLHVSPVTVAAAYRQLQTRGLLLAAGRRGTRVAPVAESLPAGLNGIRVGADLIDLATGNPDPDLLPPLDAALRSSGGAPRLYDGPAVLRSLATFAADEFAADGIAATAVTLASGAFDAIERLLDGSLRPGDGVAVEDPCLPALRDLLGASGYLIHPVPVDAEGPRPDELEAAVARGVRAVLVTSRAQNPTGAALSISRASELSAVLRGRGELLVIENDPAGPISGVPMATLTGAPSRWACVRSVSKYLGPDLRVALIAGDEMTIARVARRHALGPRWVSHLLQQATLALWSDPANGRRLARAADVYAHRRAALLDALAAQGIHPLARSGFNVWIPVREETATVQALAARGWAVAAGERFRIRSAPGIRVTTSALDVALAQRFATDCAAALRPAGRHSA